MSYASSVFICETLMWDKPVDFVQTFQAGLETMHQEKLNPFKIRIRMQNRMKQFKKMLIRRHRRLERSLLGNVKKK
jgi:hypothetical protein